VLAGCTAVLVCSPEQSLNQLIQRPAYPVAQCGEAAR